jgi:excisionase family DNA binding protein
LAKLPNHRLVKIHRSYTVEDAAHCLAVHKNTVRRWIKAGLPTVSGRGKTLILGSQLRSFLEVRRKDSKRPCPPGHLYCLKCQAPRPPAAAMTEYIPITPTSGNLKALCPECTGIMYRRIKEVDQAEFCAEWVVAAPQALPRLSECTDPSLIVHS